MRRSSWLSALLLIAVVGGCRGGGSIDITLSGDLSGGELLRASVTAAAGSGQWGPRTVHVVAPHLIVNLPADAPSQTTLKISLLDQFGCLLAEGQGAVDVAVTHSVTITLNDLRSTSCLFSVTQIGAGHGEVAASDVAFVPCAASEACTLRGQFIANHVHPNVAGTGTETETETVTIHALADDDSYFTGWGGACQGLGDCTFKLNEAINEVRVSFALKQVCTESGFCWRNPLPQGFTLYAIHGSAENDLWAVGAGGTILRYNGVGWSSEASHTVETLRGVYAANSAAVWMVGDAGTILYFDGRTITNISGGSGALNAVAGSGVDDVWIVGNGGSVLRCDRRATCRERWQLGADLTSIWTSSPDEVWVAGSGGHLWRCTDAGCEAVATGTLSTLRTVFASGPEGSAGRELWLGGDDGTLLVSTSASGADFHPAALPAEIMPSSIQAIWALPTSEGGPPEIWISAGQFIVRRSADGKLVPYNVTEYQAIGGLWGSRPGNLWAVGSGGLLSLWNGVSFTQLSSGANTTFVPLAVNAAGQVWVADDASTVWQDSAASLLVFQRVPSPSWVSALFSPQADEVWFSQFPNHIERKRADGTRIAGFDLTFFPLTLWGTGADNMWAAGNKGQISHYSQGTWTNVSSPVSNPLNALHGDGSGVLWAVGEQGSVLRADLTGTWVQLPVTPPTAVTLLGVWAASPTEMWAVGPGGTLLRSNGAQVIAQQLPESCASNVNLYAVWGSGPHDVWIVGDANGLGHCPSAWHYDGTAWHGIYDLPPGLSRVWGARSVDGTQAEVYVVGLAGTLLRKHLELNP